MALPQSVQSEPPSLDENTLNLLELAVFVEDDAGFRLGLATYDDPRTRDTSIRRLGDIVADRPVDITRLDLTHVSEGDSLLKRLHEHLRDHPAPEGKHAAVMVVGIEATIDFRRTLDDHQAVGGTFLHNANLHRDAFPQLCPVPVVLWLTGLATTVFARSAPDLWHWRSGSFSFSAETADLVRSGYDTARASLLGIDRREPERARDRTALLNDRLADLDGSGNSGSLGSQGRRAEMLHQIAQTELSRLQFDEARKNLSEALRIYRRLGDRRGEAAALVDLGRSYRNPGEATQAIALFEQALESFRAIGDRRGEGYALYFLGRAYDDQGQPAQAVASFEQMRVISEELNYPGGVARALANLGITSARMGKFDESIDNFTHALQIFRGLGDHSDETFVLVNLGYIHNKLGQFDRAIGIFDEALEISRSLGDRSFVALILANLGYAHNGLGQFDRAVGYFESALDIFSDLCDGPAEAHVLGQLGDAYFNMGQVDRASRYLERAAEILENLGDSP